MRLETNVLDGYDSVSSTVYRPHPEPTLILGTLINPTPKTGNVLFLHFMLLLFSLYPHL
jgi:hypothetical protein